MKYTEEELIALGKKHRTELTEEEFFALWEWVRKESEEKEKIFTQIKEKHPHLYNYEIDKVVEAILTLEEVLSAHGKFKYSLEYLKSKKYSKLTDEEKDTFNDYEEQRSEDKSRRLNELVKQFPNEEIRVLYDQVDKEFPEK